MSDLHLQRRTDTRQWKRAATAQQQQQKSSRLKDYRFLFMLTRWADGCPSRPEVPNARHEFLANESLTHTHTHARSHIIQFNCSQRESTVTAAGLSWAGLAPSSNNFQHSMCARVCVFALMSLFSVVPQTIYHCVLFSIAKIAIEDGTALLGASLKPGCLRAFRLRERLAATELSCRTSWKRLICFTIHTICYGCVSAFVFLCVLFFVFRFVCPFFLLLLWDVYFT